MKKNEQDIMNDDLQPEYDLAQLRVRRLGPDRSRFGTVVQLAPDVEKVFQSSEAVNSALRFLIQVAHQKQEQGKFWDSSAMDDMLTRFHVSA